MTSTVSIYGLGSFSVQRAFFTTSAQDKLLEIRDIQRKLKGEPSTIVICRKAYADYLETPTIANKEKLRIAYENVPNHQKKYVGDMNTKDIAVRMIIYGEQEIENWSHYLLAKEMGEELPTIKIPKPKEE